MAKPSIYSATFAGPVFLLVLLLGQHVTTAAEAADWIKGRDEAKAVAEKHANHHWQNSKHRLQSLKLDGHGLGDFLRHIMQHDYVLPLEQLQKSLVYTGSNFRLRKVVHDLILAKRPIKVGAIGGSITNGAKASKIGETDWFSLVGKYMKAAFPKANITTRNGALPATPSALMNMCLEQYVDEDVDLVFVEYVANDGSNRWVIRQSSCQTVLSRTQQLIASVVSVHHRQPAQAHAVRSMSFHTTLLTCTTVYNPRAAAGSNLASVCSCRFPDAENPDADNPTALWPAPYAGLMK